jgi:hypothetical protein
MCSSCVCVCACVCVLRVFCVCVCVCCVLRGCERVCVCALHVCTRACVCLRVRTVRCRCNGTLVGTATAARSHGPHKPTPLPNQHLARRPTARRSPGAASGPPTQPTFAAPPPVACLSTTSVNAPAPVRSCVSRTLLLLNAVLAPRATRSTSSRSAGWPGAAAKNQVWSWRRRAMRRRAAAPASGTSASHPATKVSSGEITGSSGRRHSASMSAYAPPMRSTTMYLLLGRRGAGRRPRRGVGQGGASRWGAPGKTTLGNGASTAADARPARAGAQAGPRGHRARRSPLLAARRGPPRPAARRGPPNPHQPSPPAALHRKPRQPLT